MSDTPNPVEPPKSATRRWLDSIPLGARNLFYGLFFLAVMLGAIPWAFYQVDVHLPGWHVELPVAIRVLGAAWFVAFLAIYIYCSYVLTSRGRGGYVEFDPPSEFVAIGVYRWCRNPVAGSVVLMLLGEALALSSTGGMILFVIAIPAAHLQVVRLEEPLLLKRFGQPYADYVARVPRWIPKRPRKDDP